MNAHWRGRVIKQACREWRAGLRTICSIPKPPRWPGPHNSAEATGPRTQPLNKSRYCDYQPRLYRIVLRYNAGLNQWPPGGPGVEPPSPGAPAPVEASNLRPGFSPSMPQYFFTIQRHDRVEDDPNGTYLPDAEAALSYADYTIRELRKKSVYRDDLSLMMIVKDQAGQRVLSLPFFPGC